MRAWLATAFLFVEVVPAVAKATAGTATSSKHDAIPDANAREDIAAANVVQDDVW